MERGFTLMELLVSMTVISLLAVTILFGWRIAAGAWGRANELVEEQRRVAAIHQVLATQMAEMTPVSPWLRHGNATVFFQGEQQTARFLSRYSLGSRSRSGLFRIEYQIVDGNDGTQQLLLNEIPVGNTNDLGALRTGSEQSPAGVLLRFAPFERTARTRLLFQELTEAHFEYYRPTGSSGPGGWVSEWRGQGNELPRAMAIRFNTRPVPNRLHTATIIVGIENFSSVRR
ncbi:MAG: type II secretion system protein [Acidobacteria bacterium]|nr:type II secretion system protein [Acidobacteriota bacterium]